MASEAARPAGHFARRRFFTRTRGIIGALLAVVIVGTVVAVVAVTSSSTSSAPSSQSSPSSPGLHTAAGSSASSTSSVAAAPTVPSTALQAALAAAVKVTPARGTASVALNTPVIVEAGRGELSSVTVLSAKGVALAGALNPTRTIWRSTALALAGSSVYQVHAVVAGNGVTGSAASSFSTLSPSSYVGVDLFPDSGLHVGVGQPVVFTFTQPIPIAARASVLAHLHVSLSTPVAIGAYWFSADELHLRPATYWPTGEQIAVTDDLDGWNAGGGAWGEGSGSVRFSIGDARVSTANLTTDLMTVTDNGKVVESYPISGGATEWPTMNGVHIVLDRSSVVRMNSATVGIPAGSPNYYNETVYWDVHISDSGEYVHAAPWSVYSQGHQNVSHGCVNLSTANAEQFFNFSRVGDVINVIGGPRPPVVGDHGVMDWTTPWASWTPIAVTHLA